MLVLFVCSSAGVAEAEIKALLRTIKSKVNSHIREFRSFRDQVEGRFMSLREDLSGLNDSVSNLSMSLQEHKQQTVAELAQLQTSLNTTQSSLGSKIDSLSSLREDLSSLTPTVPTHTCGGTGGWRRAVYLDMTDPSTTCPSGWNMTGYSKRTCGRASDGFNTCDSVTFPVSGGEYSRVCGRIKAYQLGTTLAFYNYHNRYVTATDGAFVDGISVTHNNSQQHVWTFAAGQSEGNQNYFSACPCDFSGTIRVPPFVGEDYFCESGVNEPWNFERHWITFFPDDTLWDGENCLSSSTCCSLHNPPYFVKQLPTPTTDDIEARMCLRYSSQWANIAVELIELYVQ